MLKSGTSTDDVKIYELYCDRIQKQYDLVVTHFRTYLGFNSGLVIAVGFVVGPSVRKGALDISQSLGLTLFGLAALGVACSIAWLLVTQDDRRWQNLINNVLGTIEDELFDNPDQALYKRIVAEWPRPAGIGIDVVDVNTYMASLFILVWAIGCVAALILSF